LRSQTDHTFRLEFIFPSHPTLYKASRVRDIDAIRPLLINCVHSPAVPLVAVPPSARAVGPVRPPAPYFVHLWTDSRHLATASASKLVAKSDQEAHKESDRSDAENGKY